jgi:hypothetical protein
MKIHWIRAVIAAVLVEVVLVILTIPIIAVISMEAFVPFVPPVCFVVGFPFGWWAARKSESGFVWEGTLVGIVATLIYLGLIEPGRIPKTCDRRVWSVLVRSSECRENFRLCCGSLPVRAQTGDHARTGLKIETLPGPLRDVQTVWDIVYRPMVTRHRGRSGPREVIMQRASEALVAGEADIFQRLIETRDRPLVHFHVGPVATVHPHDRCFVTIPIRVCRWPTKCLSPVCGKTRGVLWVVSVAEGMANHFILQHSFVPCAGQRQQSLETASSFVDRLHSSGLYFTRETGRNSMRSLTCVADRSGQTLG